MLEVLNINVVGWEPAIRGMRNPMNSWERSDSVFTDGVVLGDNDLDLMNRLFHGGTEHRKFMRMIIVYMDITAPLYWWKEYDTYKVGTVANSCSTMHKIHAKEFAVEDFSTEHLKDCESVGLTEFYDFSCGRQYTPMDSLSDTIKMLNFWRKIYLEHKNKSAWWQLIQLLPTNYNQKRTVMMNYEVASTIIRQRTGHKLDEWKVLVDALKDLPYLMDIMS